jgi:hypothetical protein
VLITAVSMCSIINVLEVLVFSSKHAFARAVHYLLNGSRNLCLLFIAFVVGFFI